MSRPEKFEDLRNYEQQPRRIAEIDVEEILSRASVAFIAAAANLLALAESEGYIVSRDGEWKVTREKDEAERNAALTSAQRSWDRSNECYQKYVAGEEVPDWMRFTVEQFAKEEELPAPVWDEAVDA